MPQVNDGHAHHAERQLSLTSSTASSRRTGTPQRGTPEKVTQHRSTPIRGTPDRAGGSARGTPDRHNQSVRGTPDKHHQSVRGTPDRHHQSVRKTPDRHHHQSGRGTPDRAGGSQHINPGTKSSSSRRRRHSLTEALLAKRRAEVLRERRILIIMTGLCCLASTIWLVALSTDYWVMVDVVRNQPGRIHQLMESNSTDVNPSTGAGEGKSLATDEDDVQTAGAINHSSTDGRVKELHNHMGIWRACVVQYDTTSDDQCHFHNLDHEDQEFLATPSVAHIIIDYRRTVMALAGLSLLCHLMAVSFSFYTFRNPRYTFKRLAGCIHLMTAATVVVLIEVVSNGATFAAKHLTHSLFPVGSVSYHGFSYYLAWLVAAQFAAAGLTFLLFSRKRKNLNITDEEGRPLSDDQPQFMGRN